jgi:ribonuclease T1
MRNTTSGSKWMAVVAVGLLAAVAWTSFRTPNDIVPGTPVAGDEARSTRASSKLETPPPMAEAAATTPAADYPDFLPAEAIDTLRLIERGGPYPHRRLPRQSRGYYREYTVETPGSRDRGARRIIAGGHPPVEYFYTDDHYRSFRRFARDGAGPGRRETSR